MRVRKRNSRWVLSVLLLGLAYVVWAEEKISLRSVWLASDNVIVRNYGRILRDSRWQVKEVPVCWENPSERDADIRQTVRQDVAATWGQASGLSFVGWEKCPSESFAGIRVAIADYPSSVAAIGRYLAGRPKGMILNFSLQGWSPRCASDRRACMRAVALHEFGHAIGLDHEQNRPDAPEECKGEQQMISTYDKRAFEDIGRYDPESIMNYCNSNWSGSPTISTLDWNATRELYASIAT